LNSQINNQSPDFDREDLPIVATDEFLPPISRWMTWGGFVIAGSFGVAIALSGVMPYNVTLRAGGTVRPLGETRIVQAAIEGVVERLEVEVNQEVNQGDVIATLSDTRQQIQKSQLQSSIQQNQTQITQIQSQISFTDSQILAEANQTGRAMTAAGVNLDRNQRELAERGAGSCAELREAEASYQIALQQQENLRQAVAAGAVSQSQFDERVLAVQAALGRLEKARAAANPTDANVTIASEQIAREQARGEVTIASLNREKQSLRQRQSEIQNQINRDTKDLQQIEVELQKTIIRSPVAGTILELNLRNPGQTINPNNPIARIAPKDANLVIKARVTAQDIGRVEVGQKVNMRVSAFPYPDYGTINGRVESIAADITNPANAPNPEAAQPFFEVTIIPDRLFLKDNPRNALDSGMDITADIVVREDTVLQFVLRKARLLTDF